MLWPQVFVDKGNSNLLDNKVKVGEEKQGTSVFVSRAKYPLVRLSLTKSLRNYPMILYYISGMNRGPTTRGVCVSRAMPTMYKTY